MMQVPVSSKIPHGVGCPPPPGMDPRKGKGKLMCIKVRMLDDSICVFHLGHKGVGQALFDEVCRHLNLLECDYFGLEFIDSYGNRCWLEKEKSILRQIMAAQSDARFFFVVKFYTPNPAELEEEYTRYLFALQIRRDLARGELICNENTAALLVSYIVQSECGDFSVLDYPDHTYLSGTQFVPNQNPAFQLKVMEHHKTLIGMSPGVADFKLLETARRCDFYGVRLHNARDIYGAELTLSVAHMGIKVFDQLNCAMTFSWAKIRKLSFKRRHLMIKIYPDSIQQFKESIEFVFENRDDCKNFWKKCVEHHSFFRCPEPTDPKRDSTSSRLFHRGSNFRYHGRTQKQLIDYVREHRKRREPFQRPIRRSGITFDLNSSLLPFGCQKQLEHAFFVSDRMIDGGEMMFMDKQKTKQQEIRQVNFCPIFCQQQPTTVAFMNGNGCVTNGNTRPKSAAIISDGQAQQQQQKRARLPDNMNMHNHHPVLSSCYGNIPTSAQTTINDSINNGNERANNGGRMMFDITNTNGISGYNNQQQCYQQQQHDAFHQQMDPMSMSLPNVLAPSALQTDGSNCFYTTLKSMSGENFHVIEQCRHDVDNQSEGSYRIGRDPSANAVANGEILPLNSSSQSDIGSSIIMPAGAICGVDPRVYQTTFTTKRMGKVIMKKVTTTNTAPTTNVANSVDTKNEVSSRSNQSEHSSTSIQSNAPINQSMSSEACSHYSTASAPMSTRSAKCVKESRIRYAPTSGGGAAGISSRFRYEIPVAIDSPQSMASNVNSQRNSSVIPPIIRPLLIPPPSSGGDESKSTASDSHHYLLTDSLSSSANSTPNTNNRNSRKPLVVKTDKVCELKQTSASGTTNEIVPITQHYNGNANEQERRGMDKQMSCSQMKTSKSDNGPKMGRVINREDLVITPNGIELKKQKPSSNSTAIASGNQKESQHDGEQKNDYKQQIENNNKPKVPPKPDLQTINLIKSSLLPVEVKNDKNSTNVVNSVFEKPQNDPLSGPLDSILNDVKVIDDVLGSRILLKNNKKQKRMLLPAAIAIQSEERPDLKTVHLFNETNEQSDAASTSSAVPYTLTVRNLSGNQAKTSANTTKSSSLTEETTGTVADVLSLHTFVEQHAVHHCKSIELVNRRRLPSQDSYSSQDHSISPTSPDTGNVLEYILRRRSQSSDRAISALGRQQQQQPKLSKTRHADRRMTQPIEFDSQMNKHKEEKQTTTIENSEQKLTDEGKQDHGCDKDKIEGAVNEEDKVNLSLEKRFLETDF